MNAKKRGKQRAPKAGRPASPKAFSGSGFHSSRGYTKRERADARSALRRAMRRLPQEEPS